VSVTTGPENSSNSTNVLRLGLLLAGGLALLLLFWRITGRTAALAQEVTPVPYTRATDSMFAVAIVPSNTPAPTATFTAVPSTAIPTVAATPTALPSPTPPPTQIQPTTDPECALYQANTDLLLPIVTRDIELGRDFEPTDLVTPRFAFRNSYIVPIQARNAVIEPLSAMLEASNNAGLQIMVVSGYRSYAEQQLANDKWNQLYPDRAASISALPGHSEHQLGTAIDFSTPYMEGLYQNLFHTNFFYTPEGQWLNDNAASFGFTLSYPSWAIEQTGYEWEPWHFRYVGVPLAQELNERRLPLIQYVTVCSSK
jgi:LAS superfamily LD-carboxypeptidase LdcB